MKSNTKRKIGEMSDHELVKKYHYLRSKLSPKANDISVQMKYIKFHIKKRGLSI
jgi:hypothetical protein